MYWSSINKSSPFSTQASLRYVRCIETVRVIVVLMEYGHQLYKIEVTLIYFDFEPSIRIHLKRKWKLYIRQTSKIIKECKHIVQSLYRIVQLKHTLTLFQIYIVCKDFIYLREAAPNVVKDTHFFGDNFVSIAIIHVKFQSNKFKSLLIGVHFYVVSFI